MGRSWLLPLLFLSCLVALPGLAHAQPVPAAPCYDDCCWWGENCCFWSGIDPPWCTGRWYGGAEALVNWRRDNQTNRLAVIEVTSEAVAAPGTAVFSTGDLEFDDESGFRVMVGRRIDECRAWEASYFGIDDWASAATVTGANNIALPGDLGAASLDFFAADTMNITYQTRLQSAEFNWIETHGGLQIFGGFRYLSLREEFNIESTDADSGTSDYNIRSQNDLYGAQYGGRYAESREWWGWDITGKVGVLGNVAEQTQFVTDSVVGGFLRDPITAQAGQVAFLAEANLSAQVNLTKVWSVRAGYNVLWIQGLALAPDQLDFRDSIMGGNVINSEETVFYHGASVGLYAHW